MASVWRLEGGAVLVVANGTPMLVIDSRTPLFLRSTDDLTRGMRTLAETIDSAAKAVDAGVEATERLARSIAGVEAADDVKEKKN